MGAEFAIVEATQEHICEVCLRARDADKAEAYACGETIESVMTTGMNISTYTWAGLRNGKVICVFGVASPSVLSGEGVPWMVGTTDLDSCAKGFLPRSRVAVGHMLSLFDHLENYVDSRNTKAIKWLRWLGFTIHPPAPHGPMGIPFHRFDMRR